MLTAALGFQLGHLQLHLLQALAHRGQRLQDPALRSRSFSLVFALAAMPVDQVLVLVALRVDALLQGLGTGFGPREELGELGLSFTFCCPEPDQLRLVSRLDDGRVGDSAAWPAANRDKRGQCAQKSAEEYSESESQNGVHAVSVTATSDTSATTVRATPCHAPRKARYDRPSWL